MEIDHQTRAWVSPWLSVHTDMNHPGTRDTCEHCQMMIREYGEMPSKNLLIAVDRTTPKPAPAKQIIPQSLRWQVWERDDFTCLTCGTRRNLSVDHIIPESRGGQTILSNLQTLCRVCNSKKGVR